MSDYVASAVSIVTQLHAAGAEEILFVNIPSIGQAPAVQALGPGAVAAATMIAAAMNASVDAGSSALAPDLLRGLHRLDLFGLMNQVVLHPAAFGFTDVVSACAFVTACIADPSTTFFWDGVHPTAAGHALIARAAFSAVVPEPATFILFGVGLVGFGVVRFKASAAGASRT